MGCDPKLSSCDSIGFVRPVSLKKNSPLIKLRVGWFSALFFGLNSLTWAWCEFALNQARLAPMPWLTLGSQACASVRDLGSLQYLMGGGTVRCLFSHWVCLRPDHLGKHCSLRKGSHEFPQLAISFEAVQKLAYLKNQIAKIRMTQSGKAEVWTCTKCSWLPLFVVHKIMFDSVDQYLTPNPRKTIAEN